MFGKCPDQNLPAGRLERTAWHIPVVGSDGGSDIIQAQLILLESGRVHLDPDLLLADTQDPDGGDPPSQPASTGGPGDDTDPGGESSPEDDDEGDFLNGGTGDDTVIAGDSDVVSLGAGADVLRGGGGKDVFVFQKGSGVDRIVDFRDDVDTIRLSSKLGIGSVDEALEHATEADGRVVFDFGADRLVVLDVTKAELHDDLVVI